MNLSTVALRLLRAALFVGFVLALVFPAPVPHTALGCWFVGVWYDLHLRFAHPPFAANMTTDPRTHLHLALVWPILVPWSILRAIGRILRERPADMPTDQPADPPTDVPTDRKTDPPTDRGTE